MYECFVSLFIGQFHLGKRRHTFVKESILRLALGACSLERRAQAVELCLIVTLLKFETAIGAGLNRIELRGTLVLFHPPLGVRGNEFVFFILGLSGFEFFGNRSQGESMRIGLGHFGVMVELGMID